MIIRARTILLTLAFIVSCTNVFGRTEELVIIGGGMAGGMEAYYAYLDAKERDVPLRITIYEKNESISATTVSNLVPSLTCDEILSVVPRGPELARKLEILFSDPGGIRVDDVPGINGTLITECFKQGVQKYSLDEVGHKQRTEALLTMGKKSMDLWLELYNTADQEMKEILKASNFNFCGEPSYPDTRKLYDGYRIDLIYQIPNIQEHAMAMKQAYEAVGCKQCAILTPEQVMAIDPYLTDFCKNYSVNNAWNNDTVALWRPGGCLDTQVFLPKLYEYLKKHMGTYINEKGQEEDCFQIHFGKKVTGLQFAYSKKKTLIAGLVFEDSTVIKHNGSKCQYVFCPGEAVGTLHKLGLREPAYAGFAGASLLLNIPIPEEKIEQYRNFGHCMEVHQEGIVLAWQARFRNNKIFIGVAGTKAFYSDQRPTKDQEFARNRNLVQLNIINDVLPEFISLALGRDTKGLTLTVDDLSYLESQGIAVRWTGVRSVVYDGFPSLGYVYEGDARVDNARCTTHLGSGGVSFSPAAVTISRSAMHKNVDAFTKQILEYASSARAA